MLIKRFLIVLITMLTGAGLSYGQNAPADTAALLKGEWQIEKIKVELHAQQGNMLLEIRTYTSVDSMKRINAFVPLAITFLEKDCIVEHQGGTDQGRYKVERNGVLEYMQEGVYLQLQEHMKKRGLTPDPDAFSGEYYSYRLTNPSRLVLRMPASFYQDNNRNLAVKLICTCYYQKKSSIK
jgi:PhoPQ-activated pathogenicity-related protein